MKIEVKTTKNERKYIEIARILPKNAYLTYKNLLIASKIDDSLMKEIDLIFSQKNSEFVALGDSVEEKNNEKNDSIVRSVYLESLKKIFYILSEEKLLAKINGLKILISGQTGTGKTTLAKYIISQLVNYEIFNFVPEMLISSKMGQTQLNLLQMASEIKELSKKKKIILYIDEVDSILSSRNSVNDVAEYQRIVSSFIKILDELDERTLVIFSTNVPDKIDDAIVRRMNFKIYSKYLTIEEIIKNACLETDIDLTSQQKNLLKEFFSEINFSISELNSFVESFLIDKGMNEIKKDFTYLVNYFEYKQPKISNLSNRMKAELGVEKNDK